MSEPVAAAVETPSVAAPDFAAFEATENAQALGEPTPAAPTPPAEPEPPDPEADEHDTPEAAAPTPTPDKPISKRQQQINDLIRARTESDQRAEALEAKLAALEAKATPAAEPAIPAAKTTPESFPKFDVWIALDGNDNKDFTDWMDARDAHRTELASQREDTRIREVLARERREQDFATAIMASQERGRKAYPDFEALLNSPVGNIPLGRNKTEATERVDFIAHHPQSEHIQYAILKDPALAQRLGQSDPYTFGLTLGSLLTSASASAGPAAKPVTTAPAPPTTLAARSADPADPVAAAVARGDYRAFEAEENRRAITASR